MRGLPATHYLGHAIAVWFILCCLACGCGMFGKSCEELNAELSALYDGFLDDTTDMREADILQRCNAVMQQCPDLPIAWELAGIIHWENDRMKEALDHYKKALALSPDSEELLIDAMLVAFETRGDYLFRAEDGTVQTQSFAKINLEQYPLIPADIRLLWCESALSKGMKSTTKSTEIKNRQGEVIGTTTFDFRSSIKTPQDLDAVLIHQAKLQPLANLAKATGDLMLRHSSSDITTEFY